MPEKRHKNFPSFRSPCILMNYISAATSTISDVSLDRYIEKMHIRTTNGCCCSSHLLSPSILTHKKKITKIFVPYFSDVQCAFELCCSSQSTDLLSAEYKIIFFHRLSPPKKSRKIVYIAQALYTHSKHFRSIFFIKRKTSRL